MRVEDAAKHLQMNTQTLRLALQQRLFPFGVAVKTSENRFTYYINRTRLEKYLEGIEYDKDTGSWNVGSGNAPGLWRESTDHRS